MEEQARSSEPLFHVGQAHFQEVAQALLSAKSAARSVDSGCQALVPLANKATADELRAIASSAKNLSEQLAEIYNQIAATAFQ